MLAVVTAEIVWLAIIITATAIVGCIMAYLDKCEAVNEADKMGELAWDVCEVYVKALDEMETLEKERDSLMETVGYQQVKLDGLKKGSGENLRYDKQQTGQKANEKKGEAPTDPNHSGNRGTRPPDSLSGMPGPESKTRGEAAGAGSTEKPGKTKFKFTPYEPFALGRKDSDR